MLELGSDAEQARSIRSRWESVVLGPIRHESMTRQIRTVYELFSPRKVLNDRSCCTQRCRGYRGVCTIERHPPKEFGRVGPKVAGEAEGSAMVHRFVESVTRKDRLPLPGC